MKMRMKRIMGLLLALFMIIGCLSLNPIASYADDTNTKTFNINDGSVNITQSGNYTIEGTGYATSNTISVTGSGIKATITLNNVNIDVSNQNQKAAFLAKNYYLSNYQSNVHLTIILTGTNSLKSGRDWAGLAWNNRNNDSTLEIKGDGSLTATGGKNGAGIGSSWNHDGGTRNIKITGGTVIATGGYGAAGIGGDRGNSAENITITGGTVTATGGDGAAGIGGGGSDSGKNITITGGTVTATGGDGAAGIGGGRQGGSGENITITGGTVTATGVGWKSGAGIGGGGGGSGENITITGGTVTARGGDGAAGIGGGDRGSGENITIAGGTVTATGGEDGIGGGAWGAAQHIKITGGSVKASSISTTPTDDNGHNVYLVKLENKDGVNEVTVDSGTGNAKTFKRAGNHPDRDTTFYLYLTGKEDHDLDTSKGKYKAEWTTNAFTVKAKVFDKENVTAMEVTTQPTKRVYTDGEPLDLTGLKVTLTDNQTLTQEVEFKDFQRYGINATPDNGTELKLDHNGKPVKLKSGKLTAVTSNLKVAKFNPTAMTVEHQPNKLSYTEGEKLDLTGLSVKLSDGHVTRVVEPKDFTANNITATPENGTPLTVDENNGNPVKLTKPGLPDAVTGKLIVYHQSSAGVGHGSGTGSTGGVGAGSGTGSGSLPSPSLLPGGVGTLLTPGSFPGGTGVGAGSSTGHGTGVNDDAPTTLDRGELNIQIDGAEGDSKPGSAGDGSSAGNGNTVENAPEVKRADAAVKQALDRLADALAWAKRVSADANATRVQVDAAVRRLVEARKALAAAKANAVKVRAAVRNRVVRGMRSRGGMSNAGVGNNALSNTVENAPGVKRPQRKPRFKTPAAKPQSRSQSVKRVGVVPKRGGSALYAGLLAVLGFSVVGITVLCRKRMMEGSNE